MTSSTSLSLSRSGDGHLERGGGLRRLGVVAPEDRRAALRGDHRVVGVLEDEHAVGHADAERAAAAALAQDHGDDRHPQLEELAQVDRDRLGDVPLLRGDAGIGAGRVDEA